MQFADCGKAVFEVFKEMLKRAGAIKHKTVWVSAPISNDIEASSLFILCTTDAKRASQVKECLEQAGLLCDTDLGTMNMRVPSGEI